MTDLAKAVLSARSTLSGETAVGRTLPTPAVPSRCRTKSAAGVRDVAIPSVIVPELRKHLRCWAEPGPGGRVFVGERGATPRRRNFNRLWKAAIAAAGIDAGLGLHFHDLRHTGNYLAASGATLRDAMARMGHASMRAALIYQHADRAREREIADRLSRTIEAALPVPEDNGHVAGTAPRDDGNDGSRAAPAGGR